MKNPSAKNVVGQSRASKTPTPPSARKKRRNRTLHGVSLHDDYAWLRTHNWQSVLTQPELLDPEIRRYLEQENAYTEKTMAPLDGLCQQLFRELRGRIKEEDASVPDHDGPFAYYTRSREGQQHPIFCRKRATDAESEVVLYDCNIAAAEHSYFECADCAHSPDHRYFAYCIDTQGGESYTLQIRDVETGRELDDTIPGIQGSIEWTADSRGIVYVGLDENHRPDHIGLHRLGDDPTHDAVLYREHDPGFFIALSKTRSGRFIVMDAHDHITSEVRLLDAENPLGQPLLVQQRETGLEYSTEERNGILHIISNADGHENYKLSTATLDRPERRYWTDVYIPADNTLLDDMMVARGFIARLETKEGLPELTVMHDNGDEHKIAFREEAYDLDLIPTFDYNSPILRFGYSSMTTPECVYDYDTRDRTRTLLKQEEIPSGHNPADYTVRRLSATANDGTDVPISLLHHKDARLDGNAPLLLYGYGAYGSSIPTSFSPHRLSLVKRGFIYAVAHTRGGMEKGYAWYRQGKLKHKKNTFSDFISAAEFLCEKRFCRPGNIAIHGGSAGGMLIGYVLNTHPDLFRAAVADVPFVDVLNTICDDSLPLTPPEWNEWGNPIESREMFEYIASYSPYDNIKPQAYPHILATAGISDPRVTYWEPAKWVAKLRATKTDSNLLLLKTNLSAGHSGVSGRFDRLKEIALRYAFLLYVFNLTESEAE